ncbi:MAG: DNA translocase FtsK 4TM domain-containing protein, partial [Planctomycetota bacterium]
MRHFLPIKGPGGRALTPKEKAALIVLSITLILFVLTLLAGDDAFREEPARNPVFALVAALARPIGVGIIALYGVVLLWSGLLFFKGERAVRLNPLPGRMLAALGITVGVSGLLGIAQLELAGDLGATVGGAIGHTFGAAYGFPILLAMMILGGHLAGQGAWTAFRGAPGAMAAAAPPIGTTPTRSGGGFHIPQASPRIGGAPTLPDDGDPTADERSFAITQAMEEIERSKGVTIVEVDDEDRESIGEQVESVPTPHSESEEGEVKRGLDVVAAALERLRTQPLETAETAETAQEHEAEAEVEVEEERRRPRGFVAFPAPVTPSIEVSTTEDETEVAETEDSEGWEEWPDEAV